MALLDVRDLKIAFYDTTPPTEVVKGISFSLEEGETLGIVGESGSGKTQTALSILHLLKENSAVSGGEILYEDSSVAHASSQDLQRIRGKEISMIFQEPMTSLNPVLTIEEQIAEGLLIHESCTPAERHEKVLAIMHEVELPDPEKLCKKYPHQLSGGQRQRVMIAAALITEPKLLVADEPTTALDVTIQSQILKLLKKINERHHTAILFISHDLGVIRSLCDRVIVMNAGHILQIGKPQEVFDRPASPFIADFMGFSTFLHGIAAGAEGDMRLIRCGAHTLQVPAEAAQELTEGDACILAIRSENIQTAEQEGANTVRGTVKSATYKGHTTRLEVSGCFEEMVYPAIHEYADVQEGSEVLLHFPAQHFCVYKDIK